MNRAARSPSRPGSSPAAHPPTRGTIEHGAAQGENDEHRCTDSWFLARVGGAGTKSARLEAAGHTGGRSRFARPRSRLDTAGWDHDAGFREQESSRSWTRRRSRWCLLCIVANGIVATQAAEGRPQKLRTLVYLAAYLPPVGDAAPLALSKDGWARNSESLSLPVTQINLEAGWAMLARHAFREVLYADCPDEDVALADALLTPEPCGPHSPTNSPIRTTPGNFGRDRERLDRIDPGPSPSPGRPRSRYRRQPPCQVLTINSSHCAYFSQPDQLTKHILTAGGDRTTLSWQQGQPHALLAPAPWLRAALGAGKQRAASMRRTGLVEAGLATWHGTERGSRRKALLRQ